MSLPLPCDASLVLSDGSSDNDSQETLRARAQEAASALRLVSTHSRAQGITAQRELCERLGGGV
eukprot:6802676-Pyramimonas_sp.AAC.1